MPTGPLTIYNDVTITGNLSVTESLLVHNDTLFVDNDTNNVGIGTLDPSTKLNVAGDILASGYIKASGDLYGNNIVYNTGDQTISGIKTFNQLKTLSGSPIALKAIDPNYSEPREFTVINKKYADENFNLCIKKDLSLYTNLYLDFPTGTGIDSSSSNFPKNTKKVSLALMQPSGFGWGVNYNNVDWLTSSPPNPTFGNPTFSEFYPQGPHTTRSYGIHLNAIANLEKNKSDIVYRTGNQTISGYKRFEEDVYIKNLYVTGAETIVSSTNTNVSSNYLLLNITGGATDGGVFFVTGSGLTGVNDSGAIIGFDDFENFKFGIGTRSQDLNSLDTIASTKYVDNSVTGLSGFVFDVASTEDSIPNTLVSRSSLGYSDFSQIGINETNYPNPNKTLYKYNNITYGFGGSENPDSYSYAFPSKSGEIALDTTAVMLTGNQTVQGNKTISGILYNKNNNTIFDSTINHNLILSDANTTGYVRTGYNINLAVTNYMTSGTGVIILPTGSYSSDSLVRNGGLLRVRYYTNLRPTTIKQRVWTGGSYHPTLEQTLYTFSGDSLPYGTNLIFISSDGVVWEPQRIAGNFYNDQLDPIDVTRINGVAVTGDQTINGVKNFTSIPTVNNTGIYLNSNPSGYISSLLTSRTIYVDSSVGADTRTSLSQYDMSKPFTTISGAAAASATGDLIYVRAGTYAINSQINLNNQGSLYFEPGATVNITNNVTGFSFNQATNAFPTGNSIRIQGHADFVLTGSAGILTIPTSLNTLSPPIVAFECNSITGPNAANGTLFNIANGVLSVDAKTIAMTTTFAASNATVFNITGNGGVTARIPYVYCGRFVNGAGAASAAAPAPAQINADVWTLVTYNATAGMNLNLITTSFRIVNYNHVGVGAAFSWTENSTIEGHAFRGITWNSLVGQPNITFASTDGSTTNKRIRLDQTNIMRAATTNSLSSNVPINVGTYGTFASVPATSNVTFKIGSFTVDADVNTY
jgi:hypothetical protein